MIGKIKYWPSRFALSQRHLAVGPLFRERFREVIEEAGGMVPADLSGKAWEMPWAGAGFLIDVQQILISTTISGKFTVNSSS